MIDLAEDLASVSVNDFRDSSESFDITVSRNRDLAFTGLSALKNITVFHDNEADIAASCHHIVMIHDYVIDFAVYSLVYFFNNAYDGRVVVAHTEEYNYDVSYWRDVVKLISGEDVLIGIRKDGKFYYAGDEERY